MPLNRKLTPLIAGRTIRSADQSDNLLSVSFTDDSVMKIKTAASGPIEILPDRTVKAVRQKDDVMNIDFTDASTVAIKLAEATSSVMLRDGNGKLEYAD
jgi:hypothetical protein